MKFSAFIPKSKCRYHIPEDMGSDYCDSRNMSSVGTNSDASSSDNNRGSYFAYHFDA